MQNLQQMMVQCPEGAGPGTNIVINANGQNMQVQVPPGVAPGQQFQIQVPAPAPIVVMAEEVMPINAGVHDATLLSRCVLTLLGVAAVA